ncbi:MAG: polysaccharide deacetylase family protein [Thermoanaerobaculia bacterium]
MSDAEPSAVVPRTPSPVPVSGPPTVAPVAAFTVDVEDWYQSSVDFDAPISNRVVGNVDRIVALLDEHGVKGTFFVQGLVARRFPGLVQRLAAEGHEVQSHGHTHRPLFGMDPAALRAELQAGRKSVEDAASLAVTAFRAPDFSIVQKNLWALQVLAEEGFRVDSSVFPVRTRRYGISGWKVEPQRLRFPGGTELLEVPVATWGRGRLRLPAGGGGYFRLLPLPALVAALRSCIVSGRPPVVYFHPYEFNRRELDDFRGRVSWPRRLHQGIGRKALEGRVRGVLRAVRFGRLDRVLRTWGLA